MSVLYISVFLVSFNIYSSFNFLVIILICFLFASQLEYVISKFLILLLGYNIDSKCSSPAIILLNR